MRILRKSIWPGAIIAVLLETAAFIYLSSRPEAYTGSLGTWSFSLIVLASLPLVTLWIGLLSDPYWSLRLLLVEGLLVFWGTLPETALLPVRWLIYAALVAQANTFLPPRWKNLVSGGFLLQLILVQHAISDMTSEPPDLVVSVVSILCVMIPGFLLQRVQALAVRLENLEDRNEKLHSSVLQLTSANTEFLEQATNASEESAVLERHRITRDLHDVVGQTLTNIIMMMDAALHRKAHEPEETVKLLKWIRKQAQTGLEETRGVLYELRSFKPTTLRGLKALKKLIETFGRLSRIKTKVEWGNLPWTFQRDQEHAVYHLVQAALSNSFRHGSATRIDLHFQVDRGVLHILIRDNGKGGADAASGLGQRGMEERLARWAGSVSFHSEPYGYVVSAALPLVADERKETDHGIVQSSDR